MASTMKKCDVGRSETQREYIIRPVRNPFQSIESDYFRCLLVHIENGSVEDYLFRDLSPF
jgi:hypothetical protein